MTNTDKYLQQRIKGQLQSKTRHARESRKAQASLERAVTVQTRNDPQPDLHVVERSIDALKPGPRRVRRTTTAQLERVVRSIGAFQQVVPILIDAEDYIVSGHAVWEAMRKLERATIQCIVISHLDQTLIRAFAIAYNRLGETGEWVIEDLRIELEELGDLNLDLELTAFTIPELDIIMAPPPTPGEEESDLDEEPAEVVARPGDLFALGDHLLLCGDALNPESYRTLMGDGLAACVFSDPPYNCKIEGNVSGLGQHKHKDFAMAVGEMSAEAFAEFLRAYLQLCCLSTCEGAVVFACMDWRQIDLLFWAGRSAGLERINMAVWDKGVGGMGGLYRSQYELVAVFCNGKSPAVNNVALGKHGRDRTNVWTYPGANRRGSSAANALGDHPTPKPVPLVADALLDVTDRGAIVLDPFMGSGSTLMACEQTARCARGIELDPGYIGATIRRWEADTGKHAVHVESGLTYSELADYRSGGE